MTTTLLGCSQDDGSNKQAAKVDAGSTDATPQPGYEHAEKRTVPGIFSQDHLYGTLPNGLRFIVVPTDYPDVVSMQIAMQTGSRNEVEPGKSGFAHFFEHMMFRGTENYSQEEYQAILKSIGADTNAYTSDDLTNYYLDFTKEDLETVMEVEADRFQNLQYTEDQFRTEALAVKGEYLKNSANPIRQLIEEQRKIAYDTHTYQHTTMGFFEDIEQMPEQFDYSHEFFKRWYRPEFATLVVVGDVDARETYQLIEKYWGAWTVEGENNVEIPQEQGSKGPQYSHITWPSPTQPWVSVSFRGPAYDPTEKDMAAIDLISAIYFSSNSEIYRDLVIDKQWATSIGAYFPNRKDPGQLMVYAQLTDEKHGRAVMDRMLEALQQARTELVDADKLADTQSNLKYGFANNLDNSSAIASTLASYSHFTRTPVKTINNAYEQYGKLTAEDIRAHANEYFTDDTRVIVTLSASESMAGMNDVPLLDDMVAAAEMESAAQSGGSTDAWSVTAFRDAVMGSKSRPGKVSMVEMPGNSDLVNVSWLFNVGAARDPEGKKGLAELTARMIASGGSEFHDINAITEAFYPMAAGFGSQVGKEMTRFSGTVHKDNLDRWYAIAAEQLLAPGWRESDFQRIKQQLLTTISDGLRANNDEEFAKEAMYEFIYGDEHPYGSLTLGHLSDVKALTLDDVKLFYAKHYTPQNLTVGLAGGYSTAFRDHLLADLTALPNGDETQLALPEAPAIDGRQAMIIQKETQPVAVSFGFPIDLVRGDDDWVALWLVRSWLGEHRSSNSHLYQRIRATRGMNYGDYAYIEYFPRGMFTQSPVPNVARQQQIFQVWLRPLRSNNDAHFATRVALYELDKLLENGMSEQNFEATRDFLDKYVAQMVASQGRQLAYMLDSRFYGIDAFADYVRAGLQKLTLEDVNRVIGEHLQTENIKFVFISNDAEDLKARLVENRTSPMTYQAQQPEELLAEDQVIQDLDLKFSSEAVTIVPAEAIFD
ncbi:MAG: pitrilysin family protein [Gammaproteobacteria bacterium]|nr:pitrilysin family protein [Gammaproteobacteria bacterium]